MRENKLYNWYLKNKRDLPWRKNKNPYYIWISETMLQQTTTTAVIPYFEKFIKKFPTISKLALAKEPEVLSAWAGLGYYSRARNLHKAAKQLVANGEFKKNNTFEKLITYPGFGPYTSRSVASIAFQQNVGVLDGNVIRVLSRLENLKSEWWKTKERNQLQSISDEIAQHKDSSIMNQALMELGATLCTPKNPSCLLCPVNKNCESRINNTQELLPLKKPKKDYEFYIWEPQLITKKINKKTHVALIKNEYAPFLKNQWLFPGKVRKLKLKPNNFSFKHSITHYQIFVTPKASKSKQVSKDTIWVDITEIPKWNPTSLVKKTLTKVS